MAAVEHVVMSNTETGDVVVVAKSEYERVWSADAAAIHGLVEHPWQLAKDDNKASKEKILAAARVAAIPITPDAAKSSKDKLITHIQGAASEAAASGADQTPEG